MAAGTDGRGGMRGATTGRTVADVMRDAAAAPAEPRRHAAWMAYLERCAVAQLPLPGRRTVLVLPSSEYAPATLALAVVEYLLSTRAKQPLDVATSDDVGRAASVFTSGSYSDSVISAVTGTRIQINGSKLEKYLDIVRILPDGFLDPRPARLLNRDTISVWTRHLPPGVEGARVHARVSATPIVVIGNRAPLLRDLEALQIVCPDALRLADVGGGTSSWFRHPVICLDPGTEVPEWLRAAPVSLVIAVGAAGWRSPVRHALGAAPQVLVLDRRSGTSVDVVDDIVLTEPVTVPVAPEPPMGIEAWGFDEALIPTQGVRASPDDEDLF